MFRNPLFRFLALFFLLYGLFIFPWPGLDRAYANYFIGLGEMAFTRADGDRVVQFEPAEMQHGFTTLSVRMALANRGQADRDGNAKAIHVTFDVRSIGWVPTALTAALILASPVPWWRRLWALIGGLVLIQLFILFTIQVSIWDNSPAAGLIQYSPFWQEVMDGLNYVVVLQLGASFSIPLVIWILVTFRSSDAKLLQPVGHFFRKHLAR